MREQEEADRCHVSPFEQTIKSREESRHRLTHTAELTEAHIEDASNILVAPSASHDDDTVRSPATKTSSWH
ncbi:hypothetical protein [Streptomyces sp. NPDC045714]|uniref:hypothetical protein n=1 Tax=Streptomyces sp. NPDC045714 TaxID=3154913 RepID=UPI0033E14A5D